MKRVLVVVLFALVALLLVACSVSTANIQSATLGKGFDSTTNTVTDPTTTFGQTDEFHSAITVANAPEDTTVRTVWSAVDVTDDSGKTSQNQKIDEATFNTKDIGSVVNASLLLDTGKVWPVGKYKLDIYLDDKLAQTLEFSVAK